MYRGLSYLIGIQEEISYLRDTRLSWQHRIQDYYSVYCIENYYILGIQDYHSKHRIQDYYSVYCIENCHILEIQDYHSNIGHKTIIVFIVYLRDTGLSLQHRIQDY